MDNEILQIEIKSILLEAYTNLQNLNASKMLQETKKSVDSFLIENTFDTETSKNLNEVSDLCFESWAPMCENVLSTYQKIQYFIIPKLEKLLTDESLKELDDMLTRIDIRKIDYQNLKTLPTKDDNFDLDFDIEDFDEGNNDDKYTYEDGPFCSACQQAPCMCSDPERSSMTQGF